MKTNELFAKMFSEPGFKIRQKKWDSYGYWYFDDKDNIIRNNSGAIISAYLENIFQKDWEVYQEQPKKVKKTFHRAWFISNGMLQFTTYEASKDVLLRLYSDFSLFDFETKEVEVDATEGE